MLQKIEGRILYLYTYKYYLGEKNLPSISHPINLISIAAKRNIALDKQ